MKNRIVYGVLGIFVTALLLSIGATFAHPQSTGPITTPQLNTLIFPGQVNGFYPTIQTAVTKGCTLAGASIVISPGSPATGTSGWTISAVTGGCTKASILDQRVTPGQWYTWNGSAYTAVASPSGNVASGTTGQIAQYPANGTTVQGATASGDATIAPGGAVSVNKIHGVAVTGTPTAGQVPTAINAVSATWQTPTGGGGTNLKPATELWGFGDSYIVGSGATQQAVTGIFGILSRDTPAAITNNNAQGGALSNAIALEVTRAFLPNPTQSAVSITDGGANDGLNDTCGGVSPSACVTNFKNFMMAQEAWLTIPFQFRQLASTATQTGSWSVLTGIIGISPIYTSNGNALQTGASGATLTFAIPSSASPVIGLTYVQFNGQTGTFTVSIDGTLRTDDCSSTTTFSSGPCTTVPLSSTSVARQEYAVTPGISHTVVITTTNASAVQIVSTDWIPPAGTANENAAFVAGVNATFANSVIYDTASKAVVTQLAADGLPVYFVDLQHGTPGMNNTTDISTSATATCPASTLSQHPNDCGYANFLTTVQNTEIAANYIFSQLGAGGKAVYLSGKVAVPLQVSTVAGTLAGSFSQLCTVNQIGCGATYFNNNAGNVWGSGFIQDASGGLPWSGGFNHASFGTGGFGCFYQYDGSGNTSGADFSGKWCVGFTNGNVSQLGGITLLPNGGANQTISFGQGFGVDALKLFDDGATNTYGWGLQSGEMQFHIGSSPSTTHYSWNGGGTLNPSGTNEFMRLYSTGHLSVGTTTDCGTLLGIGSGCPFTVDASGNMKTPSASVLAATTTGDVTKFDNTTGHLADSGVPVASLASVAISNAWAAGQTFQNLAIAQTITNAGGLQVVSGTGCAITIGAIGNSCTKTITLSVVEPDALYIVSGCTAMDVTAGPIAVADVSTRTTTNFAVKMVALSATSSNTAGAGTINCTVTHQ